MEVIKHSDCATWDHVVKSFANYDVYYLHGYVEGFRLHGDGEPILLYSANNNIRAMCVLMLRDIAESPSFNNKIPSKQYYDAITPYGYGGFLVEGDYSVEELKAIYKDYIQTLRDLSVVSVFYRFHPMLKNAHIFENLSTIIDLGNTIHIDLTTKEDIWNNLVGRNRTSIRKAQKNDVKVFHGRNSLLMERFVDIYNKTMDGDQADDYYYFKKDFYDSILDHLDQNSEIFYAVKDEKIVSASIILFANKQIHYHLSGSDYEYRNISPSNLLLYEVACWGVDHGYETFHLGGGLGSSEDSLFRFKQSFNKNSKNQFSVGFDIIDHEIYQKLVSFRKEGDPSFDSSSKFFPLYRSI